MNTSELVRAALVTPDAAGALADWLEERGDHRGRLLRIRWRRFRTEYHRAETRQHSDELFKFLLGRTMNQVDLQLVIKAERDEAVRSFARYLRERFQEGLG